MVLMPWLLIACSAYTAQLIDRDVGHWYPFDFSIDGKIYQVRLPPKGMIIKKPVTNIMTSDVDDYIIAASFGYDYGRGSYNDIAQVDVGILLSRIGDGISCDSRENHFGDCILKNTKGSTENYTINYTNLGAFQWFHESDSHPSWESYSIMINDRYYLRISGNYWRDLAARPDMLADRKKLLKEIVSTVEIIN